MGLFFALVRDRCRSVHPISRCILASTIPGRPQKRIQGTGPFSWLHHAHSKSVTFSLRWQPSQVPTRLNQLKKSWGSGNSSRVVTQDVEAIEPAGAGQLVDLVQIRALAVKCDALQFHPLNLTVHLRMSSPSPPASDSKPTSCTRTASLRACGRKCAKEVTAISPFCRFFCVFFLGLLRI